MKLIHSFPVHFTLSASLILAANASFLMTLHNISDGRLLLELPITSALILLWVIAISFISKRFFAVFGTRLMTAYVTIISIVFIFFAHGVERSFQDFYFMPVPMMIKWPILGIFSYSVYIVILGGSLVLYPLIAKIVQIILTTRIPVASEQISRP